MNLQLFFIALFSLSYLSSCTFPGTQSKEKSEDNQAAEVITEPMTGEILYKKHCRVCHGPDGKKGLAGAKDLSASVLTKEEQQNIIRSGKKGMPGMGSVMNNEEVKMVVDHIQSLKEKNR